MATAQLSAMEKVDKTSEFLQKLTQHLVRLIYVRRHTHRKRERETMQASTSSSCASSSLSSSSSGGFFVAALLTQKKHNHQNHLQNRYRSRRKTMTMARQNEDNNDGNNSNREEKEGQFSKAGRSGTNRKFTEYSEEELRAQKAFVQGDFGKVSTAKETWEPFVRASRAGLLDEMQKCENSKEMLDCDAVLASLFIAVEDDAFKSRTSVCLPQEAYVKRLRKLMDEFEMRDIAYFNGQYDDRMVLKALERYLYEEHQYRPPVGWMEAFSPYRTYFHNVIAQKVGIPASLAALYMGCVQILRAREILKDEAYVLISSSRGLDPDVLPRTPWGITKDDYHNLGIPADARWCTPKMSIQMQLRALKRAFWPWTWDDRRDTGIELALKAAVFGNEDRMQTAVKGVGIIQPTGRPFGDLEMAIRATERLALVAEPENIRDYGILLYHSQRYKEAYEQLQKYQTWRDEEFERLQKGGKPSAVAIEVDGTPNTAPDMSKWLFGDPSEYAEQVAREEQWLKQLMLILERELLEQTLNM